MHGMCAPNLHTIQSVNILIAQVLTLNHLCNMASRTHYPHTAHMCIGIEFAAGLRTFPLTVAHNNWV